VVYGDPAWFVLADPPLTMVQVPYAGLARRAAGLLLRALDAREAGLEPPAAGPHLVPGELRVAGSTAPPGGPAVTGTRASSPPPPYRQRARSYQ